jgi:CheY-like chemotaxis protein
LNSESVASGAQSLTSGHRGCRVLVVDDNVDSAQSMGMLLELEGFTVELAYDGDQALSRAAVFQPDAVLLDIGLPGLNGYQVAQQLREHSTSEGGMPILLVAVSGYGRDKDRQTSRLAGFNVHLTKPADPAEVLRVLDWHCAESAANDPTGSRSDD